MTKFVETARAPFRPWNVHQAGLGFTQILIGIPIGVVMPFPMVSIGLSIMLGGVVPLLQNSRSGQNWVAR
jgi:predicted phage tail protein